MPIDVNILIPAYNPDQRLLLLVQQLIKIDPTNITVVNDGSAPICDEIFDQIKTLPKVRLLEHASNLGKGAALKTGFADIQAKFQDTLGIVTADADGQHRAQDILKIAQTLTKHPDCLILGVRSFDKKVPFRSKLGNVLTRKLFQWITGQKISDTQTGLRGIPLCFIPDLLAIKTQGYEFELDMLLLCKYKHCQIVERKIKTLYINHNKASHFNPVLDSFKIYFELLRYILLSIATAIVDYTTFAIANFLGGGIFISQVCARTASVLFNYPVSKKIVFYSNKQHRVAFPKYVSLVAINGIISYGVIRIIVAKLSLNVLIAKMISEFILYICNFIIQRDLIFKQEKKSTKTRGSICD